MRIKFAFIILITFTSIFFAYGQDGSKLPNGNTTTDKPIKNSTQFSFYKCPKCDNVVSRISEAKLNTKAAKLYTDGKLSGPAYIERPEVVICNSCSYPFWMKDDFANPDCFQSLLFAASDKSLVLNPQKAVFYGPETYDKFLRNHVYCSRDEEKYLLTRYWWALNDKVRNKLGFFTDPCDSDTVRANLGRLIMILEEENDELFYLPGPEDNVKNESRLMQLKCLTSVTRIMTDISDIYTIFESISNRFKEISGEITKDIINVIGQYNKTGIEKINNNLIMTGEIYRNLGLFEDCTATLSFINSDNRLINLRKSDMSELCINKIRLVNEIQ